MDRGKEEIMSLMKSKFSSKCRYGCGQPIAIGETIDYDKDLGGAAHVACADRVQCGKPDDDQKSLADRLGFKDANEH